MSERPPAVRLEVLRRLDEWLAVHPERSLTAWCEARGHDAGKVVVALHSENGIADTVTAAAGTFEEAAALALAGGSV